ncbi:MAG: hypothetical protein KBT36_04560 [Kurthia sp.]|nr:hypothetical protein [Candidatus Kurthia equi]
MYVTNNDELSRIKLHRILDFNSEKGIEISRCKQDEETSEKLEERTHVRDE